MEKRELINWFLIIGIIVVAVLLIYVVILVKTEGAECMINPVGYYQNLKNVSCNCMGEILEYPLIN